MDCGTGSTGIIFFRYVLLRSDYGRNFCEPLIAVFYEKCGRLVKSKGYAVFQIVRTSVLVVIGEMIFRANGAKAAIVMLKTVFGHSHMTALGQMDLPSFGIDRADIAIVLCGVILVTVVGLLHERGSLSGGRLSHCRHRHVGVVIM